MLLQAMYHQTVRPLSINRATQTPLTSHLTPNLPHPPPLPLLFLIIFYPSFSFFLLFNLLPSLFFLFLLFFPPLKLSFFFLLLLLLLLIFLFKFFLFLFLILFLSFFPTSCTFPSHQTPNSLIIASVLVVLIPSPTENL